MRILFIILFFASPLLQAGEESTKLEALDPLIWEKVAPGVWRAQLGEDEWGPLDFAEAPRQDALAALGETAFPLDKAACVGLATPSRTQFRMPLGERERIYGLGLEFEGANRRGEVYHLKVDHYGGVKGHTHAPVPFYLSSAGYGVLIDTARRPVLHVGIGNRKDSPGLPPRIDRTTQPKQWQARPASDAVEGSVEGPGLEIFVFAGNSLLEVVQRYNLYGGGGALPPRWGLGFWHRTKMQSSDREVLAEAAEFRKHDFPLDVIGLEPGWQSAAYPCTFDWDPVRFSDPKSFLDKLGESGVRVNLWENPYVHPDSTMYEAIRPYTASHTVWLGEVPDYSLPEARNVLTEHHRKNHLDLGVSGYKFDEVDGYDVWLWPDHATFPSGHDGAQMRQVYGLLLQKLFMDAFRARNQRTYGLIRASNAGASAHAFVLYSDYYDHRGYVTALTNSSLAGLLWTPEIRSARSAEEWLRRFQTVAFSPMLLLNAWSSGAKPWSFPEVTDEVRDVVRLRMRLFPYLYSAFADYQRRGIPPFRSMMLESGFNAAEEKTGGALDDVANPYAEARRLEKTDQYMMGPSILVAPAFTGETSREVVLPAGNWYDFYTGEFVGNGETITTPTPLERVPLFVKDGGIVPMMPATGSLGQLGADVPLEMRHYGTKPGNSSLYDDDGETFDYEQGVFSITPLRVEEKDGGSELAGEVGPATGSWKSRYGKITWRFMTP